MTLPPDAVLRERHLKSALGHIQQAVGYTEGLVGRDGADVDRLYAQRGALKYIAERLNDLIGDAEVVG